MKETEPIILDLKVQDRDLLALKNMIKERKRITRKLQRLPHLRDRLEIEKPGVTLQELADRLKQKKSTIDKEIAKYNNFSKAKRSSSPHIGESIVSVKKFPPDFSQFKEGRHPDFSHFKEGKPLSYYMEMIERYSFLFTDQQTCPTLNGTAMLFLSRWGATNDALNSINHHSSANYDVKHVSYFLGKLDYQYDAFLDDDASAWRDDNPDSHNWYDNIYGSLPRPECDSRVVASVEFRSSGRILSEADDHNEIEQTVYIAHSDEDGNLPPYVSFGEEHEVINYDLSGSIGLPGGNRYDSGWFIADMSFNVRSGVRSQIAIAPYTNLSAQDGLLNILGNWEFKGLSYSIVPI